MLFNLKIKKNKMIISHKSYKARKPYKCELSGKIINEGEQYISVAQKVGDVFFSIKVCINAWDVVLYMLDACGNTINECLDEDTYLYLIQGE